MDQDINDDDDDDDKDDDWPADVRAEVQGRPSIGVRLSRLAPVRHHRHNPSWLGNVNVIKIIQNNENMILKKTMTDDDDVNKDGEKNLLILAIAASTETPLPSVHHLAKCWGWWH